MKIKRFGFVVEGDGEVPAFPTLIRRIAGSINRDLVVEPTRNPVRLSSGKYHQADQLARAVNVVARYLEKDEAIFVLRDADDLCAKVAAPEFQRIASGARPDRRVSVVLADREFESWFVAAAESLRDKGHLTGNFPPADQRMAVRDAKGWLSQFRPPTEPYKPKRHQERFTLDMDLEAARANSRSFRKMWKEIELWMESFQ